MFLSKAGGFSLVFDSEEYVMMSVCWASQQTTARTVFLIRFVCVCVCVCVCDFYLLNSKLRCESLTVDKMLNRVKRLHS